MATLRVSFFSRPDGDMGAGSADAKADGLGIPSGPRGPMPSPPPNNSTSEPPMRIAGVDGVAGGFSGSGPSIKCFGPFSTNPWIRPKNLVNVCESIFATIKASLLVFAVAAAVSAVPPRDMSFAVAEAAVAADAF